MTHKHLAPAVGKGFHAAPIKKVQLFLKWLCWQTKAPTNKINVLTRIELVNATLKYCQEPPKSAFMSRMSA